MMLYHGSNIEVSKPDVLHSRPRVDFGAGFYVTPIYEQAEKWCQRFKRNGNEGIITTYSFDDECLKQWKVLEFDSYSEEWLEFVLNCRRGLDHTDYDIVIGGVANDKVFNTVELYFEQLIDKKEAIKRLRFEKPNFQVCFRNQKVIDECLHFERSEQK